VLLLFVVCALPAIAKAPIIEAVNIHFFIIHVFVLEDSAQTNKNHATWRRHFGPAAHKMLITEH
jgi:hypothetical protein